MRRAALVLVACSFFPISAGAASRPMRIDDVLGMRRASDPQLSPDGSRAAFEAREWNREKDRFDKHLYVADLRAGSSARAVSGAGSEWQPRFGADGTIAFLSDRDGSAAVYALGAAGSEPHRLFTHPAAIGGFEWSPDGKAIVFLAADSDPAPSITKPVIVVDEEPLSSRLWRWSAGDGSVKPLTEPAPYVVEAVVSPDSRKVAYLAEPSPRFLDTFKRELYVMPLAGGPSQRLTTNQDAEFGVRWSPDGSRISFLAPSDGNPLGVGPPRVNIVPAGGGPVRTLARQFEGYIDQHEWLDDADFVVSAGLHVDERLFRLSSPDEKLTPITEGEGNFGPFAMHRSGAPMVLLHDTPERPRELWLRSEGKEPMRQVSNLNPELEGLALGKVETLRWKSADGVEIEGLAVYPTDYHEGRRYPTILDIHGGPEGAHTRGFIADWSSDPQIYAAAGYVTFLPNFRGSSNYGARFSHGAGSNSAALEDGTFQDLMTGLDSLVARGIADPERLAVKGWSYGGYSTSWVIGHTDRFKVAAYGAGDTNLISYYGTAIINPGFDMMNEDPYGKFERWTERSPLTSTPRVKTPCLIFQGEKDQIVPIGQSQEFYAALKHYKVPTKLVIYPDQPHGIGVPSYQRDKMQRELDWIDKYLKATPAPAR